MKSLASLLAHLGALLSVVAFVGCGSMPRAVDDPARAAQTRALHIFDGESGRELNWSDVIRRCDAADAIFIGERHDDPTAHRVQLAVYEDVLARHPGTVIGLEHLERTEQSTLDRYLHGQISPDQFINETDSRNWAGKDSWVVFWQPLIDRAREGSAPAVAGNAPRDYVRRARSEGYDALDKLSQPERSYFDVPIVQSDDASWNAAWNAYKRRFREFMAKDGEDIDGPELRERSESVFLSQSTWDGTMGASAANALAHGAPKVVFCAGCFHIERLGGTVLQFMARRPQSRVVTITVIDDASTNLRKDERKAADIVIYGEPVKRKEKSEALAVRSSR